MVSLASIELQKIEDRLMALSFDYDDDDYRPFWIEEPQSGDNELFSNDFEDVLPSANRSYTSEQWQGVKKKKKVTKPHKNSKNKPREHPKCTLPKFKTIFKKPIPEEFKKVDMGWLARNNLDWRIFVGANRIKPVSEVFMDRIVQLYKLQANTINFENDHGLKGPKRLFRSSNHISRKTIYNTSKPKKAGKSRIKLPIVSTNINSVTNTNSIASAKSNATSNDSVKKKFKKKKKKTFSMEVTQSDPHNDLTNSSTISKHQIERPRRKVLNSASHREPRVQSSTCTLLWHPKVLTPASETKVEKKIEKCLNHCISSRVKSSDVLNIRTKSTAKTSRNFSVLGHKIIPEIKNCT